MEPCCCVVVFLAAPLFPALVGKMGAARALTLLWAYVAGGCTVLGVLAAAWFAGFLTTGGKDPNTLMIQHLKTALAAGVIVGILVLTLVGRRAERAIKDEEEGGREPGGSGPNPYPPDRGPLRMQPPVVDAPPDEPTHP